MEKKTLLNYLLLSLFWINIMLFYQTFTLTSLNLAYEVNPVQAYLQNHGFLFSLSSVILVWMAIFIIFWKVPSFIRSYLLEKGYAKDKAEFMSLLCRLSIIMPALALVFLNLANDHIMLLLLLSPY
jgi:hypothetical protein